MLIRKSYLREGRTSWRGDPTLQPVDLPCSEPSRSEDGVIHFARQGRIEGGIVHLPIELHCNSSTRDLRTSTSLVGILSILSFSSTRRLSSSTVSTFESSCDW